MSEKSVVSVLRTQPATVLEDVRSAMEKARFRDYLDASKPVILKDNISWHFPFLGANTTPWQLEGVILTLKDAGYNDIVCVQNETVVTNAFKGERMNKYVPIFKKYGIKVLYNFKESDIRWIGYKPKAQMRVLNDIFPDGLRIPEYFVGKNIVHLPTVKCHIYTGTTGSMKNAFGGLLTTRRHYTHSVIHETLNDLLAIQKEIHSGIFTVMDGTVCGNGPGPRTMIPVEKDLMLASGDSTAIDSVAAKMMGFDPMNLKFIRIAHESGLGNGHPDDIEVVGEDVSRENWEFTVGNNAASAVGKFIWFGPLEPLQRLFFRTPLVYAFVFGSFFYHDFVYWPLKAKPQMEAFKKTSKWGKLFDTYPEKAD
ncbi:MAG TPA: DUF362 domain-containing protein [Desulfomonilaceae bacterium]|nr:DUF362 domain-containing protein [Desulfomonilaceae bacterium]